LILPLFALKGTRLNWPVFSRLKRSVSKNTGFQREFCRALAPFPLEFPASDPARKLSVGEWIMGEGMSGYRPPFIKGVLPVEWRGILPGVRVRVIIRPPPFELAY
jgi:hypothetical protein